MPPQPPEVYKTGLKKAAEEFGAEVVDMNDEKNFGKRFHTLSFGEAIERNLLTDYRVLIVGVDNERIKEWIEKRLLVSTDTELTTDARSLAAQIGLLKAIKDWDLTHRACPNNSVSKRFGISGRKPDYNPERMISAGWKICFRFSNLWRAKLGDLVLLLAIGCLTK